MVVTLTLCWMSVFRLEMLKVEDSKGMYHPLFMHFKHLPRINLEGDLPNGMFGYESSS